ncbi:MAG: hypothetical protein QME94_13355 [Anaerolineae bacterium]|nr:hypothetical protein [Anaerolineae bacterium]
MIPSYMLNQAYVKGSLKNTESGFEFTLRNTVDSGTIIAVGPLAVDEASYPAAALTMVTRQGERRGDEISSAKPLFSALGTEARVVVEGRPLAPGAHRIVFPVLTSEAGRLQIEFSDTV